jgi:hypothetical protein
MKLEKQLIKGKKTKSIWLIRQTRDPCHENEITQ